MTEMSRKKKYYIPELTIIPLHPYILIVKLKFQKRKLNTQRAPWGHYRCIEICQSQWIPNFKSAAHWNLLDKLSNSQKTIGSNPAQRRVVRSKFQNHRALNLVDWTILR